MANRLLQRLALMYGQPDTHDPVAWFEEAGKLLKGYDPRVLEEAFDLICKSHRGKSFPAINEIVTGCADAASILYQPKPHESPKQDQAWTKEAIAKADAMFRQSQLAHQACSEGWGQGLHEFLRVNKRWPKNSEIADIKDAATYVERVASGVEDFGKQEAKIVALANSILDRRETMAARIYGYGE